jgi:UDP-N-acetylmuramate dehydrogenase
MNLNTLIKDQGMSSEDSWKDEILEKWARSEKRKKNCITDVIRDRLALEFKGEVFFDEPMSRHTSIRIGGKADIFVKPKSIEDIPALLKICREEKIPYLLLGSGSNTLVKDGGIRGMVITLSDALKDWKVTQETETDCDVYVESGVSINAFVNKAAEKDLTGMETLIGIPGTMGGAIFMNAGARGVEIKDLVREITVMDNEGQCLVIPREKLEFSYRHLKLPKSQIILSGVFRLAKGETQNILETIREYQKKRVDTQPLNYPSLGSIFMNPEQEKKSKKESVIAHAGQLIEEAGLKNVRVGGARISEKHANFIVNEKEATAKDVLVLIHLVKDKVKEVSGIVLETEIKVIGEEV